MPIVPKVPLARRILADVVAVEEVARRLRSEAEGLFCATCPCVCLGSLTIEALEVRLTAETPGNPPLISLMTRKGPGGRRQNLRTKRHERIAKGRWRSPPARDPSPGERQIRQPGPALCPERLLFRYRSCVHDYFKQFCLN